MCIRTIWGRLPSKAAVILSAGFSCLFLLLLLQVLLQAPEKAECPASHHFYWVITSSRLHLVNRVALESIFLHHPTACLSLYMRAGMEEAEAVDTLVQRLKSDGYQAETVRYNFSSLLSEAVVNINSDLILKDMDTFLPRVEEYQRGQYWTYSHESNFVRLLVILQRGGIYIDSDLIVTKPFAGDFQNSVGHEMPLGMDGGTKVNNNVLIFEPGHLFLIEYLHQMFISYDPKLYHANGPNLITKVYQMAQPEVYNYTVLRGTTFQPVHLNSMPAMFSCLRTSTECAAYEATIASEARGVHLNNRLSREYALNSQSLVHRLLKANCLYCHLLEFEGVVLLENTKGWAVGSPKEEKLLMAENLKEKLKILKGHLKETSLKKTFALSRER